MLKTIYILLLVAFAAGVSRAQDYNFSQYFLDKLSISPAFVSVGDYSELGCAVRSQWTAIDGGFRIYMVQGQLKLPDINSGLGARVYGNLEGGGAYRSTGASLLYGYDLSITDNIKCSLGMEAGYHSRSLHQQGLVYYSMLNPSGPAAPLNDLVDYSKLQMVYFGAGFVLYSKLTLLSVGFQRIGTVCIGDWDGDMGMGISLMANHKFVIDGNPDRERQFVVPWVSYSHTPLSNTVMPGVYYSGLKLLLQLAYRMQFSGGYNSQAVVTCVGFDFGKIEISLGHDFETSRVLGKTCGSTEAGLKYKF